MAPSERNILGSAGRTHTLVTPRRLRDCKFARQPSRRTRHTPATSLTSLRGVVTSGTPNTIVSGHQACDSFHIYFYFHFIYWESKLAIFARISLCLFTLSIRLLTCCFVFSFPSWYERAHPWIYELLIYGRWVQRLELLIPRFDLCNYRLM